jgi:uncharacterized repeat protein (TIGR03809 family)
MTHRVDVAHGRDVVARWCALAEQRLEYLTELFETGRWRRFHSEVAFLENIQEAKTAVETWRGLVMREASRQNSVAVSWQSRGAVAPPRGGTSHDQVHRLSRQPAEIAVRSPLSDVSMTTGTDYVYSDEAPSAPDTHVSASDSASKLMLDIDAIAQRYPLLRNAL